MSDIYQIVAECAYVTEDTPMGRARVLRYKGALVSPHDPGLPHLLSSGLVAQVGGGVTGGVNADGAVVTAASSVQPARVEATPASDGDSVDAKRAAARAKLPADGSLPKATHGQDVWVEYHVSQGGSYDDLVKHDKDELIKLAKQRQQ